MCRVLSGKNERTHERASSLPLFPASCQDRPSACAPHRLPAPMFQSFSWCATATFLLTTIPVQFTSSFGASNHLVHLPLLPPSWFLSVDTKHSFTTTFLVLATTHDPSSFDLSTVKLRLGRKPRNQQQTTAIVFSSPSAVTYS